MQNSRPYFQPIDCSALDYLKCLNSIFNFNCNCQTRHDIDLFISRVSINNKQNA